MTQSILSTAGLALAGLLGLAAPAVAQGSASPTMDGIRSKGQLACGVSTGIAGFALADSRSMQQRPRDHRIATPNGRLLAGTGNSVVRSFSNFSVPVSGSISSTNRRLPLPAEAGLFSCSSR